MAANGQNATLTVLGIETSCDETAAAVVSLADGRPEILSDVVLSQVDAHAAFGGVVPEVAARAHVEALRSLTHKALTEAGVHPSDLDGVAATAEVEVVADPAGDRVGQTAGEGVLVYGRERLLVVDLELGQELADLVGAPALLTQRRADRAAQAGGACGQACRTAAMPAAERPVGASPLCPGAGSRRARAIAGSPVTPGMDCRAGGKSHGEPAGNKTASAAGLTFCAKISRSSSSL